MLSHCVSNSALGHRKRVTEKARDLLGALGGLVIQEWEYFFSEGEVPKLTHLSKKGVHWQN